VGPSAKRLTLTVAIALPLAGCTTTMHAAQRERLESARQRAALQSTRVTVTNPLVTASAAATISSQRRTAVVVTIHNGSRRAVTDLPISVGYTRAAGQASVLLNAGTDLSYFDAHLPAIRAGRDLTWVYTTTRRIPRSSHIFARVGEKPSAPAQLSELGVRIGLGYSRTGNGDALSVKLQNSSGVPQYELQVYAYAQQGGRYVAAGSGTVADLGAGATDRLRLPLVGSSTSQLHVEAIPTILQ
jgi:hypothetical protein